MIDLRKDQLEAMKALRNFHVNNHRDLQPLQAIQEFNELSQELTKYMINVALGRDVNYLNLYNELFDAYSLMLTMYRIFVKDLNQQGMFRICADNKINREIVRWGIDYEDVKK